MGVRNVPASAWSWRGSALVFVLVATPQIALLGVAPDVRQTSVAAAAGSLITYLTVLLAALILYLQYRLSGGRTTAWLAAALTVAGVQGMAWSGLRLGAPHRTAATMPWPVLVDLACALGLLAMLLLASRAALHRDPMAVGIWFGVVLGAARLAIVAGTLELDLPTGASGLLNGVMVLVFFGAAWVAYRLPDLPGWVGSRLAASIVLLSLSLALSNHATATWLGVATLLLNPAGAVLLCSAALAWLRLSIRDSQRSIARLSDRLHTVEAGHQADRERLHEINGTIAGIASASRLIQDNPAMPTHHAEQLRRLVDVEVERLERLMQERQPQPLRRVDLDETIHLLVTSQHVQGRTVYWRSSGEKVRGRPDDVAEVLNILLNNAARHAPDSPCAIAVERVGDTVRVAVSDRGPGVPAELRSRIFEEGARDPNSPGQGIGLAVARRLMEEQGGYVRLLDTADTGATFVVGLHHWGEADDAAVAR